MRGTDAQKAMAQDAVDRWWWPALMMFGPPDTGESAKGGHTEQSMAWGIKRFSNDDLRQKFVDMMVPQAERLGLDAARPASCAGTRSAATTTSAPIDWDEFWRVLKGDGPCNAERLAHRRARTRGGRLGARGRQRVRREARRPRASAGVPRERRDRSSPSARWPLWEVFVRSKRGLSTCTSAPCTRPTPPWRCATPATSTPGAGGRLHLGRAVPSDITASSPDEKDAFFDPAADKVYRHPTFYDVPEDVEYL